MFFQMTLSADFAILGIQDSILEDCAATGSWRTVLMTIIAVNPVPNVNMEKVIVTTMKTVKVIKDLKMTTQKISESS